MVFFFEEIFLWLTVRSAAPLFSVHTYKHPLSCPDSTTEGEGLGVVEGDGLDFDGGVVAGAAFAELPALAGREFAAAGQKRAVALAVIDAADAQLVAGEALQFRAVLF